MRSGFPVIGAGTIGYGIGDIGATGIITKTADRGTLLGGKSRLAPLTEIGILAGCAKAFPLY
jgi:hypothetical protein